MKKVNKQCLLDTPTQFGSVMHMFNMSALGMRRFGSFSSKAMIVGTIYADTVIREKCLLSSHRCHFVKHYFFRNKLLHAHVQYVYTQRPR